MTTCGFCNGAGQITCTSCGGRGYFGRLTGSGDFDMSPCAVCAGRKRIECQACHGRGQIDLPQTPVSPPPRPPHPRKKTSDVLEGYWSASGGTYEFLKKKRKYRVIETSAAGQTGEGTATLQGNMVTMTLTNILLGTYTVTMTLRGERLEGTVQFMGIPVPFVLTRD